jgi:hypothetical protein
MAPLYQLGDDSAFERCLADTLKEEGPDAANLAAASIDSCGLSCGLVSALQQAAS